MVSRIKPQLNWQDPENLFILCDDRKKDIRLLDLPSISYARNRPLGRECLPDDWEPIVHDWDFEFQRNPSPPPPPSGYGPMAIGNGTIQLHLRQGVR